ncbi:hypothetical protein GCM10009612_63420 [Streptomyces beijiangensis]
MRWEPEQPSGGDEPRRPARTPPPRGAPRDKGCVPAQVTPAFYAPSEDLHPIEKAKKIPLTTMSATANTELL